MSDERDPFYRPGRVIPSRVPQPGRHIWTLTKAGRRLDCEIRIHGEWGAACQLLKNRAKPPAVGDIRPDITAAWIMQPTTDDRGRFNEGEAVTIRLFVTTVKDGGDETVNCGETHAPWIDTHIEGNAEGPGYSGEPM